MSGINSGALKTIADEILGHESTATFLIEERPGQVSRSLTIAKSVGNKEEEKNGYCVLDGLTPNGEQRFAFYDLEFNFRRGYETPPANGIGAVTETGPRGDFAGDVLPRLADSRFRRLPRSTPSRP